MEYNSCTFLLAISHIVTVFPTAYCLLDIVVVTLLKLAYSFYDHFYGVHTFSDHLCKWTRNKSDTCAMPCHSTTDSVAHTTSNTCVHTELFWLENKVYCIMCLCCQIAYRQLGDTDRLGTTESGDKKASICEIKI